MWIKRDIKERLLKSSETRPVILLTGARQTGKSSLLQKEFPDYSYVTFDHLLHTESAKESPKYFLDKYKDGAILDEIQYVPELFREIKIKVDQNRQQYGKWILTGSQQFELMENIGETLAGRVSIMHLETLSAHELRNSEIKDYNNYLWKGGYPEIWSNKQIDLNDFFESYLRTYVERDLKTIIEVKNLSEFRRFIRIIATRAGQLVNYKDISNDVGVSDITIKKWTHALEISGLIYLLPPFYANIGKRLTKSPKIYFADHGLLCYLLGIENSTDWHNHTHKGNLWENLVMMELVKTNNLKPGNTLFFYRDQNGVEIDFIVTSKNTLYLIESKAGENISEKKLNFSKVMPLFKDKYQTEAVVAQNIQEKGLIPLKNYTSFNPILTRLNI